MNSYRFYHPIEVRYGDIDAQRHVNNAQFFTYMEQARVQYLMNLGLWRAEAYDQVGIILAEQSCTYLAPIRLSQRIEVGVCTQRIGGKSIEMRYSLRDLDTQQEHARGSSILVAYDYETATSIPVPDQWRHILETFEAEEEGSVDEHMRREGG